MRRWPCGTSLAIFAVRLRALHRAAEDRKVQLGPGSEEIEERILIPNDVRGEDGEPHVRSPITRAGTPATIVCMATSFVTTAPAPTIAPSPIVKPGRITGF